MRAFLASVGSDFDPPVPLPPQLLQGARVLVGERGPWEADIPLEALAARRLPTLVVSGGHHPAFEAICDRLEQRARRRARRAARLRPQRPAPPGVQPRARSTSSSAALPHATIDTICPAVVFSATRAPARGALRQQRGNHVLDAHSCPRGSGARGALRSPRPPRPAHRRRERIEIDETVADEFLTEECGFPVVTTFSGHIIVRDVRPTRRAAPSRSSDARTSSASRGERERRPHP